LSWGKETGGAGHAGYGSLSGGRAAQGTILAVLSPTSIVELPNLALEASDSSGSIGIVALHSHIGTRSTADDEWCERQCNRSNTVRSDTLPGSTQHIQPSRFAAQSARGHRFGRFRSPKSWKKSLQGMLCTWTEMIGFDRFLRDTAHIEHCPDQRNSYRGDTPCSWCAVMYLRRFQQRKART